MMAGALNGIKILEIANYISGPFASMLLADLGAEVTKVEMPGQGDPFRGWGENAYSPTFCNFNRNKRSITLNVQAPEGKEIGMRLARDADVVIENMRPGVLDRLGLGYEAVRAVNADVVYCSISGYGSEGPDRDRPGYDTIGQARGGLLSLLTDLDKGVGSPLSDLLTGMYACYAIQAALIHRARGGGGQKVETSLLQATVAFVGENAARYLATGVVPDRNSRLREAQVYVFPGSDGLPFVIHMSSPQKFWHAVTRVIGRPELKDDPRFVDRNGRFRNYDQLHEILKEAFKRGPREHWLKLLDQHDVPAAPIMNLKEVLEDPQVKHLGMLVEMSHPAMGAMRLVGSGIRMSETPPQMGVPPPAIGEHTREILARLGYGEDAVEDLRKKGVV
ncbi:MAG: CoA transferase [Betaproteobacteria bacterium]|nr:CoA transferase [Betaproteobacteria bacterium]MBI2960827.1 CoA transferase [Betaproteobacteria bacterium]